jgi:uncharacterized membrane protein
MYQLSVYAHILAAIVWIGGMLFLALAVVPVTRRLPAPERGALVGALGRRFRPVAWACIALLLATGVANAGFRGVTWDAVASGRLAESMFGRTLLAKLALVLLLVVLSAVHDFWLGPASARALETAGSEDPTQRSLRRRASWLGRTSAVLALIVVALAVMLVRGVPG